MNYPIQPSFGTNSYSALAASRAANGTKDSRFLDLAAQVPVRTGDACTEASGTEQANAYKQYLEKRFGPVTIQSIGKDQASLEAAGKRMSGSDIIIAPNIFEEMVTDAAAAAYYEQKISYFFTDVIPKGQAFAASMGLTFEPCGVVIHEDGTVTYICGGGDSPERVAEVNRINAEKAKKKAEQQRQYQEQAAMAAAQRRAMWEHTAEAAAQEKTFSNLGDLLKARMVPDPVSVPEVPLPAGTSLFFLP